MAGDVDGESTNGSESHLGSALEDRPCQLSRAKSRMRRHCFETKKWPIWNDRWVTAADKAPGNMGADSQGELKLGDVVRVQRDAVEGLLFNHGLSEKSAREGNEGG
jgi:hypothetical protein